MKRFVAVLLIILSVFLLGCGMQQEVIKKPASVLAHEMYERWSFLSFALYRKMVPKSKKVDYGAVGNYLQLRHELEQYFCDRYNEKKIEVTGCVLSKSFSNDGTLMVVLGEEKGCFVRVYVTDDSEIKKCMKFKTGLAAFTAMIGEQGRAEGDYVKMRGKCVMGKEELRKRCFRIINAKVVE